MGILQDVVIGTVGREHHHDSNGPEDSHWTGLQAYAEYGQHPTYAFAFKPMTTTTAAILDRLEALETDLEAQRGYIKALEYGVRALIITHPDPKNLHGSWSALLPGIADVHAGNGSAIFSAAFQQALALLTRRPPSIE